MHRALGVHRGHQPRSGDHVSPDRSQLSGRPSFGSLFTTVWEATIRTCRRSWCWSRGGGSAAVPAAVGQRILPSRYQGVQFRSGKDPVLYLRIGRSVARDSSADAGSPPRLAPARGRGVGDTEIDTRIAQYEMAYRMQTSVPEVMDLSGELESAVAAYGPDARKPGPVCRQLSFLPAARRSAGAVHPIVSPGLGSAWGLPGGIRTQCRRRTSPCAALITDPQAAWPAERHPVV